MRRGRDIPGALVLLGLGGLAFTRIADARASLRAAVLRDTPAARWAPIERRHLEGPVDSAIARDAFRGRSRHAITTGESPTAVATEHALNTVDPAPKLVLRGVVGGPPWRAVMSGLPGVTGEVVVGPGDRFGALVIARIARDRVTVLWTDSTFFVDLAEVSR